MEKLQEMVKNDPNDPFSRYAIGLEYAKFNDLDKAIKQFEELIDTDPKYLGSYYQLAKIYEEVDRKEEAGETYKSGMTLSQEAGDMHTHSELQHALEEMNAGQ